MSQTEKFESAGSNHPLALRMAAIAFLNQNITVACLWGSFSVLFGAVETRLGVGRELDLQVNRMLYRCLAPMPGALVAEILAYAGAILTELPAHQYPTW